MSDKITLLLNEILIKQAKIHAVSQDTSISEVCRVLLNAWQNNLFGYVLYSEKSKSPKLPGIYIAIQNDKVVYVGQSGNIRERLNNHTRRVEFEREETFIFWFNINYDILTKTENACIELLEPTLNVATPSHPSARKGKDNRVSINARIDVKTSETIQRLIAQWNCSQGEVIDRMVQKVSKKVIDQLAKEQTPND